MLTATGKNGRINAWEAKKTDGPFECPGCHWPAILRDGYFKIAHFAHEPGAACPYVSYQHGESKEHLEAKKEIYTALSSCEGVTDLKLERYLGPVRPDISFRLNGVPVAVEMQVSNIDIYTIAKRTKEYARRGIYLLWVARFSDVEEKLNQNRMYDPRAWERYIHSVLYHGRFYYWLRGAYVRPVHFDEAQSGYTDNPLYVIKQAMMVAHFESDCLITDLNPFSVSVCYIDTEPLPREARLLGRSTIWIKRDNRFMPVHEACKRYPSEFFEPSQIALPPDVKPFEGDPFDDSPVDPSEFLDLPPGASVKCPLHNHMYRYPDKFGNFYCNHPECWSRFHLLSLGGDLEYPDVYVVYDPRDYLPDLTAEPYYKPSPRDDSPLIPIYPAKPLVKSLLVSSGEEAWLEFASSQNYLRVAMALRSLNKDLRTRAAEEEDNG